MIICLLHHLWWTVMQICADWLRRLILLTWYTSLICGLAWLRFGGCLFDEETEAVCKHTRSACYACVWNVSHKLCTLLNMVVFVCFCGFKEYIYHYSTMLLHRHCRIRCHNANEIILKDMGKTGRYVYLTTTKRTQHRPNHVHKSLASN